MIDFSTIEIREIDWLVNCELNQRDQETRERWSKKSIQDYERLEKIAEKTGKYLFDVETKTL